MMAEDAEWQRAALFRHGGLCQRNGLHGSMSCAQIER
jgi:hypothetical protein